MIFIKRYFNQLKFSIKGHVLLLEIVAKSCYEVLRFIACCVMTKIKKRKDEGKRKENNVKEGEN